MIKMLTSSLSDEETLLFNNSGYISEACAFEGLEDLKIEFTGNNKFLLHKGAFILNDIKCILEQNEEIEIENCALGKYRKDLIVFRYNSSTPSVELKVLKGVEGENANIDAPSYYLDLTSVDGVSYIDLPLYEVNVYSNISVLIERIFPMMTKKGSNKDTLWLYGKFESPFRKYNITQSSKRGVKFRKAGDRINIRGVATVTSDLTGSSDMSYTVSIVPPHFSPDDLIYVLNIGSGKTVSCLNINSLGKINVYRYIALSTSSYANIVVGNWIPFEFTYSV